MIPAAPFTLTGFRREGEARVAFTDAHGNQRAIAPDAWIALRDQGEREQRLHRETIEARQRLIDVYGKADGPKMLARTQKFVRDTPALAKLLREHGLGSNPAIVEKIASFVFSNGLGR